jgi:hypothetical protein
MRQYPGSYHWDTYAKAPYLLYPVDNPQYMFSYEDSVSIRYKVQRTKEDSLGGIMYYDIGQGWLNGEAVPDQLLRSIKAQLIVDTTSLPIVPDPPTLLTPTTGSTGVNVNPTLTWSKVSNATGYRLTIVKLPGKTTFLSMDIQGQLDTSFTQSTGLPMEFSTSYSWTVSAINGENVGNPASPPFTFQTQPFSNTPPDIPVLAYPEAEDTTIARDVTLRWYNNSDSVNGYHVQLIQGDTISTAYIKDENVSDTSLTVIGLNGNAYYFYRVAAVKATIGDYSAWRRFRTVAVITPVASLTEFRPVVKSYVSRPDGKRTGFYPANDVVPPFLTLAASPLSSLKKPSTPGTYNISMHGVLDYDSNFTAFGGAGDLSQLFIGDNAWYGEQTFSSILTSTFETSYLGLLNGGTGSIQGLVQVGSYPNGTQDESGLVFGQYGYLTIWPQNMNMSGTAPTTKINHLNSDYVDGISSENFALMVDSVNRTGQTISLGSVNLSGTAAKGAGLYELAWYLQTTGGTGGTIQVNLQFHDGTTTQNWSATSNSLNAGGGNIFYSSGYRFYYGGSGTPTVYTTVAAATGSPVYQLRVSVIRISK